MDLLHRAIDIFLHLDKHLSDICSTYGGWTYGILFLIIFCETGLVITPFLPGDSLLFAAGAVAGLGTLNPVLLFVLLAGSAILGDNVNYWIGRYLGPKVLTPGHKRFLKKEYLDRTHAFYEKYGTKTIIMARFVPIVRTFAPFVAGVGSMTYRKFFFFDVFGGLLWVGVCMGAGYFFGGWEIVKKNFELVIVAIIFISILPMVVEYVRYVVERRRRPAG